MTDTDETTDATEAETTEATAKHTFNVGDQANVVRGKHRGLKGSILKHNVAGKTYAVELEDGSLIVVNAGNLKPPADSTVSVAALVSVLAAFQATDPDVTQRLVGALEGVTPGIAGKLAEATA